MPHSVPSLGPRAQQMQADAVPRQALLHPCMLMACSCRLSRRGENTRKGIHQRPSLVTFASDAAARGTLAIWAAVATNAQRC